MTTTAVAADFTDAQKDEWRELYEQSTAAYDAYRNAESRAGGMLVYAVEHPEATNALEIAQADAREAVEHRAEWKRLNELCYATPYGAYLKARAEAKRAEAVASR